MNTKGFLAALLSAAICTANISSASVSATEVKFDIPVCLAQSLHGSVDYKTGTYITNDYVNYRQGYSTAFETYGIIPKGTTVEVTEVFNGWGKIYYNGKIAWFKLEYADYVQPVTQTTTTITTTTPALTEKLGIYITTGDVYYRKGHKTESEAYGVIPKGSKVEVLEIYQGWGRTNYEGKDSWFYLKFADFYSESKITNPVTTSTTAAATTTTTTTITTTTSQATVSTAVTTDETPTILPLDLNYSEGDIDGNGIVDASDASTILLYYVKLQTGGVSWFNEKQILFADVNSDKKIDASDASLVLAYYCYTSTNKEFLKMKEWVSGNLVPPVETTTQPITTTTTQNIFTTTASNYTQTSTEKQSTTSSAETTTTTASETTTTSSETTTTTTSTTSTTTTTSSETITTTTASESSTSTTVTTVVTTPPVTTTTYKYPLAAKRLNEVGWKIENAFNAAAGITYYGQKPDMPQDDVTTMEWYAEFGFKNGKGNCYVMAAMFCEMAKTLGYEAHMISGKVPLRSGGYGPHSWVELTVDGKVYVCDPDFANETNRNGFMIEYGQSGTWKYTIEKRMS